MLNIVEKSLFELTVASLYVKSQHIYMFFGVKLLQDILYTENYRNCIIFQLFEKNKGSVIEIHCCIGPLYNIPDSDRQASSPQHGDPRVGGRLRKPSPSREQHIAR